LRLERWWFRPSQNHQQADGSIRVPLALRPYLGGAEFLKA